MLAGFTAAAVFQALPKAASAAEVTLPSGLIYEVITPGKGEKAVVGDLVAVRFKGSYKGNVFDDILSAPEPYYFRVGTERLLKVKTARTTPGAVRTAVPGLA